MGYDTYAKIQQMIELLIGSYPEGLTTHELADTLDVTQQTVRNYLDKLGEMEVPVIESEFRRYTINPEDHVRPLRLKLAQAWVLYLLVRRVARADLGRYTLVKSLLDRLATSLGSEIAERIEIDSLNAPTMWDEILTTLVEGWNKKRFVRIQYTALGASVPTAMTVAPWSFEPAVWSDSNYLIAGLRGRNGMTPQPLKLDRIKSAKLLDERFEPPPVDEIGRWVNEAWGIWGSEEPAIVTLRFAYRVIDRVYETHWHPTQTLEREADGSLVWRAKIAEPREMIPWIRGWGADVEVIEPEWLRAEIAAEAERTARLYGRDTGGERRSFF